MPSIKSTKLYANKLITALTFNPLRLSLNTLCPSFLAELAIYTKPVVFLLSLGPPTISTLGADAVMYLAREIM